MPQMSPTNSPPSSISCLNSVCFPMVSNSHAMYCTTKSLRSSMVPLDVLSGPWSYAYLASSRTSLTRRSYNRKYFNVLWILCNAKLLSGCISRISAKVYKRAWAKKTGVKFCREDELHWGSKFWSISAFGSPTDKYLRLSNLDRSVGLAFFFFFSAVFVTGTAHSPPIGAAVFSIDPGTGSYSTEKGVGSGWDGTGGSGTEGCRSNHTIRASYGTSLKAHLLPRRNKELYNRDGMHIPKTVQNPLISHLEAQKLVFSPLPCHH